MSDDNAGPDQAPVIAHFAQGAERIDTQGAIVFLKGDEAIKIRRAIKLPFLDYSTLEKRRAAAEAEIALNRPYAPQIYKDAAPIRRSRRKLRLRGRRRDRRMGDAHAPLRRERDARQARARAAQRRADAQARARYPRHARARRAARGRARARRDGRTGSRRTRQAFASRPDLFPADKAAQLEAASRDAARPRSAFAERARRARFGSGAVTAICISAISR